MESAPTEGAAEDDPSSPATERKGPTIQPTTLTWEIQYGEIESWLEDGIRITLLSGGAQISRPDVWIKAENIVGWYNEKAARERRKREGEDEEKNNNRVLRVEKVEFDEVYAEGFVRMKTRRELVTADRLYINFAASRGIIQNAEVRTRDFKTKLDVVLRARVVRQLDERTYRAEDGSITTCTYGEPHYVVGVKEVEFKRDKEGDQVLFTHIVPRLGGFPIFYWPFYFVRLDEGPPLRSVRFERSGRHGITVRTRWGFDLNRYERDESGEIIRDEDGIPKEKRWGRLTFDIDHFQRRGTACGPGLEYEWTDYEGSIETYYIRDRGPDEKNEYERRFLPLEDKDRGRVRLFHRHYLDSLVHGLRLDAEISYVSDRNLLEEFFEHEFEEDEEQESYLYLRYVRENMALTALQKLRTVDFQDQIEYTPSLGFTMIAQPLFPGTLYLTTFTRCDNVRNRYDDSLDLDSQRIWRVDRYAEIGQPFRLGVFNFTPFIGTRFTWFEEGVDARKNINRFVGSAGARLGTVLQRTFETRNETLGIHGLRHTALLEMRYTNNYECNRKPEKLFQFDTIDEVSTFEELSIEKRHRFETKDATGENPWEFMNISFEVEYYPDPARDTGRPRNQNFLKPFNWISNYPDEDGEYKRRNWSNVHVDLSVTPRGILSFSGNAEYNTYTGSIDASTVGVTATPRQEIRTSLYHRFLRGIADTVGTNLQWDITEIWGVEVDFQYNLSRGVIADQRYVLKRKLHDFVLEFMVHLDEGKDDTTYSVVLYPKALPKD